MPYNCGMLSRFFGSRNGIKEHLLRAGGVAREVWDLRRDVEAGFLAYQNEGDGITWGSQLLWAIDATNGVDTAQGTPSAPIKTIAEFNRRMSGALVTADILVNVIGAGATDTKFNIIGTRFTGAAKIVVSGTPTNVATNIAITTVTTLQAVCTFNLLTTGIVWTGADVGKRLEFMTAGVPTGIYSFVQEVVDANNVIIGQCAGATASSITPTNAMTFNVQTLPALAPAVVNCVADTVGVAVRFDNFAVAAGTILVTGVSVQYFGCTFLATASTTHHGISSAQWRICFFSQSAGFLTMSGQTTNCTGCVFVGTGSSALFARAFIPTFSGNSFSGMSLIFTGGAVGSILGLGMHFRNCLTSATTPACLFITQNSKVNQVNTPVSGSVGNTGFGVKVSPGSGYIYLTTKPSVTGTAGDARIGATTRLWASEVPYSEYPAAGPPAFIGIE